MFSSHTPHVSKKRDRDDHDLTAVKFDIFAWLSAKPRSELTTLIQTSVIPMMQRRAHLMFAAEIYQLFAQEPDYFIAKDMSEALELFLTDVPYPEYLHDMLAIYQFLRHNKIVESYLDTLEQALQKYAAQAPQHESLVANFYGKYALPDLSIPSRRDWTAETKPYGKSYKIMSGYLYQWAKDQGFADRAIILDVLKPTQFQSLLTSKSIFKDSSYSLISTHGMWSHTIQWWCVFAHQQETGFLLHRPLDVYQKMGGVDSKFWDRMFDNGPHTEYFTSPEFVTETILADIVRWPLLAGTLRNQKLKIEYDPLNRGLPRKYPVGESTVKRPLP